MNTSPPCSWRDTNSQWSPPQEPPSPDSPPHLPQSTNDSPDLHPVRYINFPTLTYLSGPHLPTYRLFQCLLSTTVLSLSLGHSPPALSSPYPYSWTPPPPSRYLHPEVTPPSSSPCRPLHTPHALAPSSWIPPAVNPPQHSFTPTPPPLAPQPPGLYPRYSLSSASSR
jgi:hypothetical protein